ncbi:MAG: exosortase-associated EpsI family protein [Chloroflexota bacterium]|nr:exosortase-associated EpsI family protein [Chloroflexota bacterium]
MQNSTARSIIVIGLLALAAGALYLSGQFGAVLGQGDVDGFALVADIDYWQRTPREQQVAAISPFNLDHDLNEVPMTVGDWQGKDIAQSNIGVYIVLEPEQYVERQYFNPQGQYVWLTMIGGRSSRTFHPPESCYDSYDWQTELSSYAVPLENGQLHGMLVNAHKDPWDQLSFYFYLFPDRNRDPADGIVIFRVTSPLYDSVDETMALQGEFIRHFFTDSRPTGGI